MMERSGNSRPSVPISTYGLSIVVDSGQPSLDIVFVHGFTGHPERTWTHKKGDMRPHTNDNNESAEPPLKKHKRNLFFESREKEVHTPTYWPRDLVPLVIPNARVLTYGYDTHIRHKLGPRENEHTIYNIAWNFLIALEAERRGKSSRPIYFIAHSLGGIIVKEMLRRSSDTYQDQTYLRSIFNFTIGVMFFGTPHNGADPRGIIQHCAEMICKAAGFSVDPQVINALLPRSERLQELRDDFGPRAQHQNWIIHSFQEELGKASLGNRKVVDDTPSCMNIPAIEIKEHIRRDHTDMCRFAGLDDIEFKKVASALRKMTERVSRQPRRGEDPRISEENMNCLKESLRFEQSDTRRETIKKAHIRTCRWLLKKIEYLDWLDSTKLSEHHGFLWIKGKPGTGKSTLMKFILDNAKEMMTERVIISFFFNARGEGLEKSTLGAYQSLVLQLLERPPKLNPVFNALDLYTKCSGADYHWSINLLKEMFERAILSLEGSSVVCLIDALDECNERQIRDMISLFQHVGELAVSAGVKFQVCFSSRHYPHITIGKGLNLVLEGQEGHTHDIMEYVKSGLNIGHSKKAAQIRTDLEEKAAGIFMWVVLVVEILNKEYDSGRIHVLQRRLQEIPSDLHELFYDILTRDSHNRDELILCIQWLLFATRSLRPEELYFAILSGVESQPLSRWDRDEISEDDIKRFILNSSKGLAEFTNGWLPGVQFIHESVKDFLLYENGLGRIWAEFERNFQGQSHERLKQCCIHYMNTDGVASLSLGKDLRKASPEEATFFRELVTKAFPLLEYAVRQVLYHADVAESCNISQKTFISSFQLIDWIRLGNIYETNDVRRPSASASLLYILALYDLSNLIQVDPSLLSFLEIENERYGLPLFAALATGSDNTVKSFFKACAAKRSEGHDQELFNQYNQEGRGQCNIGHGFRFSKRRNVLSYLAEFGDEVLFAIVLATKKFSPHCKHRDGPTPLWIAASKGHKAIVKLLLETGEVELDLRGPPNAQDLESYSLDIYTSEWPLWRAVVLGDEATLKLLLDFDEIKVNLKDNLGRTPLFCAVTYGRRAIVKLLIHTDKVKVNLKDNRGRTPLWQAVFRGEMAMVKLLLESDKVEVDLKDNRGRTSLWQATCHGDVSMVKLLLDTGKVDINPKDNHDRTPLWLAVCSKHEAIVKLLLDTGKAEVNSKDRYSITPLSEAAYKGNEAIFQLLLDTGRVAVDSKDNNGRTPLWWAVARRHEAIVKLLLDLGKVDVDMKELKDNNNQTPLQWVALAGHASASGLYELL